MNAFYDPAIRQLIAYGLILMVVIGVAAIVGWKRHHSRERVESRRREHASLKHRSTLARRDAAEDRLPLDN